MKTVGWFQLVVGGSIAALWAMLLVTGVPEVDEGRVDIWFHIAAELALAALLIGSGLAVLRRAPHGRLLAGVAFGGLVYSVVNSSGYYAQDGEWHWVGMFAILLLITAALFLRLWRSQEASDDPPQEVGPLAGPGDGPGVGVTPRGSAPPGAGVRARRTGAGWAG